MSKVKICGLSRPADIDAVNRAQPDYIGFVFAPSRRRVSIETAAALKERLDPRIKAVGVFVNEEVRVLSNIVEKGIVDLLQLHGEEDALYIDRLKAVCGCGVIKALGVGDTLPHLPDNADYVLFDTLSSQRGGVGQAFNWQVLRDVPDVPYFLAGGLSPDNVADAIQLLAPYCVDVSSGVETDGCKDFEKINKFIQTARRI